MSSSSEIPIIDMAVRCCSISGCGVLFPCKHGGESLTIMLAHVTPLVAFSNEKGTLFVQWKHPRLQLQHLESCIFFQ